LKFCHQELMLVPNRCGFPSSNIRMSSQSAEYLSDIVLPSRSCWVAVGAAHPAAAGDDLLMERAASFAPSRGRRTSTRTHTDPRNDAFSHLIPPRFLKSAKYHDRFAS
jgi:hypothetical protein